MAARKLGISRHELQTMIRHGDFRSSEGKIDFDDLCHNFPQFKLLDNDQFERSKVIKTSSYGRRVSHAIAPDPADLEQQLHKKDIDLSMAKAKMERYKGIVDDLCKHLRSMQLSEDTQHRELVHTLNEWLLTRMEQE